MYTSSNTSPSFFPDGNTRRVKSKVVMRCIETKQMEESKSKRKRPKYHYMPSFLCSFTTYISLNNGNGYYHQAPRKQRGEIFLMENKKPLELRAPPPSPVASSRRSFFAEHEVLSDYLQCSLYVPDLILPDKLFPKQKTIEPPPLVDFLSIDPREVDSVFKILDCASRIGCFQLVNHGISSEKICSTLAMADGIFKLSQAKKAVMTQLLEQFGFDKSHDGDDSEVSEDFPWCREKSFTAKMVRIWPEYSKLSEEMESLVSDIENVAEKVLLVFSENNLKKQVSESEQLVGSVMRLYKHNKNVSPDQWASSVRYDVIRSLIRGNNHSHALCFHMLCDNSAEFHAYSKKDWVSFNPNKDAIVVTFGDQIQQAWYGGQVIGRPILKGRKEDCISMAFLYSPPAKTNICKTKNDTISVGQQVILAIVFSILYQFWVYIHDSF